MQYADDTTVIITAENQAELILKYTRCVDILQNYFSDIRLILNVDKTKLLPFGCVNLVDAVEQDIINSNIIKSDVKFLGVWLDNQVKWNVHIDHLSNKISTYCYMYTKPYEELSLYRFLENYLLRIRTIQPDLQHHLLGQCIISREPIQSTKKSSETNARNR